MAVVLHHVFWSNPVGDLAFFRNSDLMVDFFFVLSGFVIFHIYADRMPSFGSLLRFLWLRLGRLYPLHLLMLLVFLGIEVIKLMRSTSPAWVATRRRFRQQPAVIPGQPAATTVVGCVWIPHVEHRKLEHQRRI
jgi:peptidoglycan/LPS O-acetylase OafA/YrhL